MENATSPGAATPARGDRWARLKSSTAVRVIQAYGSSQSGNNSSGLAFNAFMAMFPMILGALSIIGLVVSSPSVRSQAQSFILRTFPGRSGTELNAVVTTDLHHYAGLLGIVGVLGLLWGCTNFFASLEFCLGRIFDIGQRGFLRQRAMGAVMMLALVAALLVAVGATTLMNLVPVMAGLGPLVGFLAMALLTLVIYRLVPNRTFRIRELWPGAALAGLLIELITLLFPLYAKLAHGFDTYGQSLALFFLLATWLAFLSQFILIGAVWNRVRLGERFTASGLLASPSTTAPSPDPARHDAVADRRSAPAGDRINAGVAASPHRSPERSHPSETNPPP
ncbi:MAG: YihY/virulence factor BrkB family protein [Candidatus Dormiibacterota bacterium]